MEIRCKCELCQKQNELMILRIRAQEAAAKAEEQARTGEWLKRLDEVFDLNLAA